MNRQRGFGQAFLIVAIALLAIGAAVIATTTRTDTVSLSEQQAKGAATVVAKRVSDLVRDHQVKVALGEAQLGDGLSTLLEQDSARWPKEVFSATSTRAVSTEGGVVYMSYVDENVCRRINELMRVEGIPTVDSAPGDRLACVEVTE